MEPPRIDAEDVSQAEWTKVYREDPHTSFPMVEALMSELAVSHRDLLKNPSILDEKLKAGQPLNIDHRNLARKPGRCTSFAVKVAMNLEAKYPDIFKFRYFHLSSGQPDRSGHRLARCENTGVLIDSTSDEGVKTMKEGDWTESYQGSSKFFDGYSIRDGTEKVGNQDVPRREISESISLERAMEICVREIAQKRCLVCSFRKFGDDKKPMAPDKPVYTSMVRWNLPKRRIEFSDFEQLPGREPQPKLLYCITFDPKKGGNGLTQFDCIQNLYAFVRDPSIWSQPQWPRPGDVDRFIQQLWKAAIRLAVDDDETEWGFPAWERVSDEERPTGRFRAT